MGHLHDAGHSKEPQCSLGIRVVNGHPPGPTMNSVADNLSSRLLPQKLCGTTVTS